MQFNLTPISKAQLFDTHVHSVPHGPTRMRDFSATDVKAFIDNCTLKGMKTVCLTEHAPLPMDIADPTPDKDCAIAYDQCISTLSTQRTVLKEYAKSKGVHIAFGAEFDYFPNQEAFYTKLDQDFQPEIKVLGLHFIDTIEVAPNDEGKDAYGEVITTAQEKPYCFDFSGAAFKYAAEQKTMPVLIKRYYELMRDAIETYIYDSVAHLDLIAKYNFDNQYFIEDDWYKQQVYDTLDLIASKDLVIEINLAKTISHKRLFPRDWALLYAHHKGIPITIGSDAHTPEAIGKQFFETLEALTAIGINQIAVPEIY